MNQAIETDFNENTIAAPYLLSDRSSSASNLPAISEDEHLTGAKKAAILCLSLGEEAASVMFKYLDEQEVQILSKELALLPDVKSEIADPIVDEFNRLLLARSYVTTGGV